MILSRRPSRVRLGGLGFNLLLLCLCGHLSLYFRQEARGPIHRGKQVSKVGDTLLISELGNIHVWNGLIY